MADAEIEARELLAAHPPGRTSPNAASVSMRSPRNTPPPAGYGPKATIVEWPGSLPGDVGFFQRGDAKH